jgi:hypothetical protein
MDTPKNIAPIIDDLRLGTIDDRRGKTIDDRITIDDRRVATTPRRGSSRIRTLKGAEIFPPSGASVKCIVRNLSETGAKLEVHSPVLHNIFDLIFDEDHSRRSCCVVWRKEPWMGVKFQ